MQNIAEKENINVKIVYLKTETKPFTQNAYLLHFLEGHLIIVALASHIKIKKIKKLAC